MLAFISVVWVAVAALQLRPSAGSSVWETPEDLSMPAESDHEHSKDHPHDLTDVYRYVPKTNSENHCPSDSPDPAAVSAMYAPHRQAAATAMGASPGDAIVLFGGDLE